MISIAKINMTAQTPLFFDEYLQAEYQMNEAVESVAALCSAYDNDMSDIMLEMSITDELTEAQMLFLEAEGDNVFQKIGYAIESFIKAIIKSFQAISRKVKDLTIRSKSAEKKLEMLKKNDKSGRLAAMNVSAADLRLEDVKSLAQLEQAADSLLAELDKEKVDPDSVKGKWEAAKKKFTKNADTAKAVTATAAAVSAVVAIPLIVKNCTKTSKITDEANARQKRRNSDLAEAVANIKKKQSSEMSALGNRRRSLREQIAKASGAEKDKLNQQLSNVEDQMKTLNANRVANLNKVQLKLRINQELKSNYDAAIGRNITRTERVMNGIISRLGKEESSKHDAENYLAGIRNHQDYDSSYNKKQRQKADLRRQKAKEAADAKARAEENKLKNDQFDYKKDRDKKQDEYRDKRDDIQDKRNATLDSYAKNREKRDQENWQVSKNHDIIRKQSRKLDDDHEEHLGKMKDRKAKRRGWVPRKKPKKNTKNGGGGNP